jgi:NAD(P)H-nitrite reductase large subunit
VLTSTQVVKVGPGKARRFQVALDKGQPLDADLIIVATGVRPRAGFLKGSGVEMGQGIRVNEHLQTNLPDIYAAGDVAEGRDFSTGDWAVHPIQPTASEHGRVAALNMAGQPATYQGSLIMNVLETVGLVSYSFGQWLGVAGGEHVERQDPERFRYLRLEFKADRLVGAIALGEFDAVGLVRGLIQSRQALGPWKARLLADPYRLAEAHLGLNRMAVVPAVRRAG